MLTYPVTALCPRRWACESEPVTCRRCYHEWEDGDPAYRFDCRGCGARAHAPCDRPKGGNERVCHHRDQDAARAGLLLRCEGLSWDGRHDKPLRLSSAPLPLPDMWEVHTGAPPSRVIL